MLGPIFRYEMVASARRARYYMLRAAIGAGLIVLMWISYESVVGMYTRPSIAVAAELASSFYVAFAWATLLGVVVMTPAAAAGAIATERERRTIEYLFATDLSNSEIILSKLGARLLLIGQLLLVCLPVLSIFRLLGGIPGDLLLMHFSVLASTAVCATVVAITISVWTPRARDAIFRCYLVLMVLLFAPIMLRMLGFAMAATGGMGANWYFDYVLWPLADLLNDFNPFWFMINSSSAATGTLGVNIDYGAWRRLIVGQLSVSAVLLLVSVLAVRRVHLRAAGGGESVRKRIRFALPRFRLRIGEYPMIWKEMFANSAASRLGIAGRLAVGFLVISLFVAVGYAYYLALTSGIADAWEGYIIFCGVGGMIAGSVLLLLMGARAAGCVAYEKERDTWLSLISTPLTGAEIIAAKMLGNLYAFRWFAPPILLMWALGVSLAPGYLLVIPVQTGVFAALATFATGLGTLVSLKAPTSLRAVGVTMLTLCFVGGGYILCCCLPLMIGGPDESELMLAGCVPFLLMAPTIFYVDPHSAEQGTIFAAFVLGVTGYGVMAAGVVVAAFGVFDGVSGRAAMGPGFEYGRGNSPLDSTAPAAAPKDALRASDAAARRDVFRPDDTV